LLRCIREHDDAIPLGLSVIIVACAAIALSSIEPSTTDNSTATGPTTLRSIPLVA
jgi:hypothetical protein